MLTRADSEKREYEILSPYAAKAAESRGRADAEEPCSYRTCFQRDRDRIIHSKALRRLMDKTQVFIAPDGAHYRTRLTHTFEVSQISRSIARGLRLNEDLTEAIALGHDLGHTPFGHNGEAFLAERHKGGFKHNVQSLRVVDVLEKRGDRQGMNLSDEVRDGIFCHTGERMPYTLEGRVVRISDRIAYINHDIDDAIRAGIISEADLPKECVAVLGESTKERINTLVTDMIVVSDRALVSDRPFDGGHPPGSDLLNKSDRVPERDPLFKNDDLPEGGDHPDIMMSPGAWKAMDDLRTYMFENVYFNPSVKKASELEKIHNLISSLYDYFLENPDGMSAEYKEMIPVYGIEEMVKDQIAGMTDRYAVETYERVFIPKSHA